MPQIELWHEIVSCKHTDEQIEHAVNANFGYYPAGDAGPFGDDEGEAAARHDSADEAGNG